MLTSGSCSTWACSTWAMKGRGAGVAETELPLHSATPLVTGVGASNPSPDNLQTPEERARLVGRARLLAWGANAWHVIEFALAVAFGAAASSTALIGFGADSLLE